MKNILYATKLESSQLLKLFIMSSCHFNIASHSFAYGYAKTLDFVSFISVHNHNSKHPAMLLMHC